METKKQIGLSISQSAYGREKLRGILDYYLYCRNWNIAIENVFFFFSSNPTSNLLRHRKMDGVIGEFFHKADLPTRTQANVVINTATASFSPPLPTVRCDNRAIGKLAANHLLERGLKHFVYVGMEHSPHSQLRLAGFQEVLAQHNLSCTHYQCPLLPVDKLITATPYRTLFRRLTFPVGIFAFTDGLGFGLMEACRNARLVIPKQVALISVDNDETLCLMAYSRMTSIDPNARKLGYEAAAMLDRILDTGRVPPEPMLIPPLCVVSRDSTDLSLGGDDVVAEALRFIRSHAHTFIDVTDVLRVVSMSRRSLERRFLNVLGHGIYDEIRRSHIDQAKELLRCTPLNLDDISRKSGFHDLKRFKNTFLKFEGVDPLTYRDQRLPRGGKSNQQY